MSEYQSGNRIAKIYPRTLGGYRVWMYDIFTEFQDEKYFDNKLEAETSAKGWCNYE